jgi:hypothetical protein
LNCLWRRLPAWSRKSTVHASRGWPEGVRHARLLIVAILAHSVCV